MSIGGIIMAIIAGKIAWAILYHCGIAPDYHGSGIWRWQRKGVTTREWLTPKARRRKARRARQ